MARRYDLDDYENLQKMFESHGLNCPDPKLLPKIGFIERDVAAGFLYLTDSAIGIIDFFVTMKHSGIVAKNDALDEIVTRLLRAAKAASCELVKCDTDIYAIKERAIKHGFENIGSFQVFVRGLNG
jgi:hypothetical protein